MSVANLLALFDDASADERREGEEWYGGALTFVRSAARGTPYSTRQVAAAFAVLSPQTQVPANIKATRAVMAAHAAGRPLTADELGFALPANFVKAMRILDGPAIPIVCDGTRPGTRNPDERVKCRGPRDGCDAPLHGPKVVVFYWTIIGDDGGVTIDVWAVRAYDIALDELLRGDDIDAERREGIPRGRGPVIDAAYRTAAKLRDVAPCVMQAVDWIVVRNRYTQASGRRASLGAASIPF